MIIFTREYLKTLLSSNICSEFDIDNKAAIYDENYFLELYKKRMLEYNVNSDSYSSDESFDKFYNHSYNMYMDIIPLDIRKHIADFRVFSLRVITQQIYDMIMSYSKIKELDFNKKYDEYLHIYFNNLKYFSEKTIKALEFKISDLFIVATQFNNNDLSIMLSYNNTNNPEIIMHFKNYKVLEQNGKLDENWIMFKEVYLNEDKLEFHLLCDKSDIIIIADELSLTEIF